MKGLERALLSLQPSLKAPVTHLASRVGNLALDIGLHQEWSPALMEINGADHLLMEIQRGLIRRPSAKN